MNDTISDQVIDSSNLPANKKAKAIQKRRAAENSIEALQLKKSAAIYLRVSSEMQEAVPAWQVRMTRQRQGHPRLSVKFLRLCPCRLSVSLAYHNPPL